MTAEPVPVPAEDVAVVSSVPAETPAPLLRGRFAVFETPSGSVLFAMALADGPTIRRELSRAELRMLRMLIGGRDPLEVLRGFAGA